METFTLREVIHPNWRYYPSIGVYARVLQKLMISAQGYRQKGRWGSSGPHETLCDYSGCTSCESHSWHSARKGLATHQQHKDRLADVMLAALLDTDPLSNRWRQEQGISFDTPFRFMGDFYAREEEEAFDSFWKLAGHRINRSPNDCHPKARTLADPEFFVGRDSISFGICICYASEWKDRCHSGWTLDSLRRDWEPDPQRRREWIPRFNWQFAKEPFSVALNRYTKAIKAFLAPPSTRRGLRFTNGSKKSWKKLRCGAFKAGKEGERVTEIRNK